MSVEIVGEDGVHRMLRRYMNPALPKRLQQATKAGATVFKAPLKAEARRVSRRMARAVSVRTARRDKPATIVTFRPKIAFFRHFVIGGTRDHGPRRAPALVFVSDGQVIRTGRVRGVKPNPMVSRVADRYDDQAYRAIDSDLDRE